MRCLLLPALALLLLLPGIASAAAPQPGSAVPAESSWALVAPASGPAAAAAAAIRQVADTRGLQAGFAAGLRTGLGYDPFDAAALVAAGVDASLPLAVASHQGVQIAAVHLADRAVGVAHLDKWLQTAGEVVPAPVRQGWQVQLARKGDRPVAAVARQASRILTVRLVEADGDLLRTLHRAIDAAAGKRSLARASLFRVVRDEVKAPWYVFTERKDGTFASGVDLDGTRLRFEGRAQLAAAGLLGKRAAYPTAVGGGDLLLARIDFAPAARDELAGGVRFLLAQACPTCPPAARATAAKELGALLAGPAVVGVARIDPAGLRAERLTPAAAPFAWVAQVGDRAAAKRWLAGVSGQLGLPDPAGTDRSVPSPMGQLHFGLRDDRLYVATDAALRDRLLAATTGAAAGPGEPLQARIQPARAAEALSALSVSDALKGGTAAALFALRLQLLPLLRGSGPLELRAQPAGKGAYRFDAGWDLRAAP